MNCCDPNSNIARWIPPFSGFTEFTTSIPKIYWDVKSQEQRILELCHMLNKLICYADNIADKVNINKEDIDELTEMFNQFIESGFDDYYAEQVKAWIDSHLTYIYDETIAQVFFRLDDEGYLIAHVPSGWDEIKFSTPLDYSDQTSYGRLCLTYDMKDEVF